MKLKITLLAFTATLGLASAYTVTVTNQGAFGDPSLPIVDNTGTPLATGSFGVGFFASDDDISANSQDFAALLGTWTGYGADLDGTAASAAPGLFDLVTPASWTTQVPSGAAQPQVGQSVYVVIGNGATLASSDQLAIWKSGSVFGTEDDAGNGGVAAALDTGAGELLLGSSGGAQSFANGAINYSDSIQLVAAIPEPSTSLLAGLAGLALAVRRRR